MGILGILLLLLKIILYIFLGLLSLVLLIILLVLFVPIRYRISGYKDDDKINVDVRVSWLLYIFRVLANYNKELSFKVKVLFFSVVSSDKKEIKEKSTEDDAKKVKEKVTSVSGKESTVKSTKLEEEQNVEKVYSENEKQTTEKSHVQQVMDHYKEAEKIDENNSKVSDVNNTEIKDIEDIQNDINKTENRIKNKSDDIKPESLENLEKNQNGNKKADKDGNIKNKDKKEKKKNDKEGSGGNKNKFDFKEILAIINNEETKIAIKHTLKHIWRIIKSYLPTRFKIKGIIGTDDPATTGYIAGITSIIRPLTKNNNIDIVPNFTEKKLNGEFVIKGRIYFCVLVYHALRIIIKKEVRHLIKEVRS